MSISLSVRHTAGARRHDELISAPQPPDSSHRLRPFVEGSDPHRPSAPRKDAKSLAALIRGLADPAETPELERALQSALNERERRFLEQTLRQVFEHHRRLRAGESRSSGSR